MKSLVLILLVIFSFTSCTSKYEPLNTVKKVELNKYLGTWYEIARYEHKFEKDCKNVTATYNLKKENEIEVINQCTNINTSEKKKATGVAFAKDETFSKLRVSFFRPFYGDYWILMLDENYKYAVVGAPSREYLWILAREKTIPDEIKKSILKKLPTLGFPTNKLIWTIQESI